jgi:Xaa-Pro aminopeptidase
MSSNSFAQRQQALLGALAAQKLDAALITSPVNVRYLTGFTGSNSLLIVTANTSLLLTDPRYTLQVEGEATASQKRVVRGPLIDKASEWLDRHHLRWIGIEGGHLTYDHLHTLDEKLPKRCRVVPLEAAHAGSLDRQRTVKSPKEIALIRQSVELNSAAFEAALKKLKPGVTEAQFAAEIDYAMRRLGAEKTAFDTIIASGTHSALPHAHPRPVTIPANAIVLVDMGAQCEGYMSDMTRMVHLGQPPKRFASLHAAVLEAQLAGLAAVRAGVKVKKVDTAARQVLKAAGLDKNFMHSTGHGLGLEIHEGPRIGKGVETLLEAGMVITIEPGAYIEGFGGVRIEDTVLVTATGCEVLTPTPKQLRVLG